jgi:hypothetical protein
VAGHVDFREIEMRRVGYEAEVEARGGKQITQWSNLRHAGHATAQRRRIKLHNKIRASLLNQDAKAADGQSPIAVIVLGPPGSGKTTLAAPFARRTFKVQFSAINPDDVKAMLPEYEGWNADVLHEESSDVAERDIARHAVYRRLNIIYDIVGKSSEKVDAAIKDFDALGYQVYVVLTDLPSWKAAGRAWDRFQENPFRRTLSKPPGRFVPPEYVHREVGSNPRKTFDSVKRDKLVRGYCRLDVDVPRNSPPKIVERKGM